MSEKRPLFTKSTGVGCQGIFLTQGSNQCLCVSCIAGEFFTTSATWEAHYTATTELLGWPKSSFGLVCIPKRFLANPTKVVNVKNE